MNKTW